MKTKKKIKKLKKEIELLKLHTNFRQKSDEDRREKK